MLSIGVRYMLLATFSFAIMNASVKFLDNFHVSQIVLIRSLVSGIICLYGINRLKISPWGVNKKFLIIRGFFGVIALTLYFKTLHELNLASAVTLVYLSPIFTALFGIWWLKEKVKWIQWILFSVSFVGLGILKEFDLDINTTYLIFGILAAAFSGIAYVAVRKVKETDHPLVVVFYFPLIAVPLSGIWASQNWKWPSLYEWGILILIGLCTQVGQYYMAKALQAERAEKIVTLKYIGTVYALLFGYFIFDEMPNSWSFVGIILVASGVLLNVWINKKKHEAKV